MTAPLSTVCHSKSISEESILKDFNCDRLVGVGALEMARTFSQLLGRFSVVNHMPRVCSLWQHEVALRPFKSHACFLDSIKNRSEVPPVTKMSSQYTKTLGILFRSSFIVHSKMDGAAETLNGRRVY